MRFRGQLVEWNDARGFGFVQAEPGGDRLFVHISAWQPPPAPPQRPKVGMPLTFTVGLQNGKKRAQDVFWRSHDVAVTASSSDRSARAKRPQGLSRTPAPVRRPDSAAGRGIPYLVLLLFAVLWVGAALLRGIPLWMTLWYGLLSLWCFGAYAYDKHQARTGGWRTPESSLQWLALLGGWPGAVLAQQWLRHKSSKTEFQRVFWCAVGLNVLVWMLLQSPVGQSWLLSIGG